VDELVAHGIKPVMSVYHWDLPQGLLDANYEAVIPICDPLYRQGWFECMLGPDGQPNPAGMRSSIVAHFVDYAELLFREFAGKVDAFYTFNEPYTFTQLGSGWGHAPGVAPYTNQTVWPYIAAHNVILAHLAAVIKFRELQAELPDLQHASIGIVLNSDWREPKTTCEQDIGAAVRAMEGMLGIFADPVWGRPDGRHDYPDSLRRLLGRRLPAFSAEEERLLRENRPDMFGLNHYGTSYAAACPFEDVVQPGGGRARRYSCKGCEQAAAGGFAGGRLPECWTGSGVPDLTTGVAPSQDTVALSAEGLPQAQSKWLHQAGWGFRKLLRYVSSRYGGSTPIYVTENGISAHADDPSGSQHDLSRLLYLHSYLAAMHTAVVEDGVSVAGYYAWSLMDNFEWAEGFRERFGLLFNDFNFCGAPSQEGHTAAFNCSTDTPSADSPVYDPAQGKLLDKACGADCLHNGVPNPRLAREQTRHTKDSLAWLSEVWATNELTDPTAYLFMAGPRECWGEGTYASSSGYLVQCGMWPMQARTPERRKSSISRR